jgi:pimeloyl-ACP methyl ester carboxylesterase
MGLTWIAFPGLLCPPGDFAPAARAAGVQIHALDQRGASLMAPCAEIDAQLGLPAQADAVGVLGHSLGAITAINYALGAAPGRVRRMILIDPTPTLAEAHVPRWATWRCLDVAARAAIRLATWRGGKVRWPARIGDAAGAKAIAERPGVLPADAEREARARADWLDTVLGTRDGLQWLWREFRASWGFEELTARRLRWRAGGAEAGMDYGVEGPQGLVIIVGWRSSRRHRREQARLARVSGARLVEARGSGHLVPLTRPDLIAAAMGQEPDGGK